MRLPISILLGGILLFVVCKPPKAKPDTSEQIQAITELFESKEAYSIRVLDSADILTYLADHPAFRADSAGIRAFYARRNYQFAWFVNDSLSQAAAGFASLVNNVDTAYREGVTLRDELNEILTASQYGSSPSMGCDSCQIHLELTLTAQFFRFAHKKYGGMVGKDLGELDWFIPRKKKNYDRLLDSLAAGRMDLSLVEPIHPQYSELKAELKHYFALDTLATWATICLGDRRKIEPGDTALPIAEIRQRLMILGDLLSGPDTVVLNSIAYDRSLVKAVERFQERHGLLADGVIGQGVVRALNVTPAERVRTLLINMERLRWVPETYAPDLILVNIPEFRMHIFENGKEAWNMDVVVGTGATRTVIFSDTLSRIVFSPYWGVPASIVRNEILPAIAKNPNYLAKKGMEKIGGTDANPVIRQKPGAGNALGRVKFLFPNSYSIYFHDTPSKGGFARESRAFSHGCIRLSKPRQLAEYLLRNDKAWTPEKIEKAMFKGKETWVVLKDKRPVTIGYFTAWIDTDGRLNFRDDVYKHDERLASELFFDPTPAPVSDPPLTPLQQEVEAIQ